ncbi:MAG: hypothetical protein MI976_15300 [Pseudomonadales bacterium]|nr:hypothetical protein [Pseudomonadales bacterium]
MLSDKIEQLTGASFKEILLIEYDQQQLEYLTPILTHYCQSLYTYQSLKDTYSHLKKSGSPTVIVTNDVLPDGKPNNLIKSYRDRSCIIVMSDLCKPEDAFMFGRLGAQRFINKPFDQKKIDTVLNDVYQYNPPKKYLITTFGGLSISKNLNEVVHSRKPPYKVLEFIACIAALGGINVPVATICDYLWPDLEGDKAKKNFTICLRRARDLFGNNDTDVIIRKSSRVSFNPRNVLIDIWLLPNSPVPNISPMNCLLAKHHFFEPWLPEYDQYWAIEPRKKYSMISKKIPLEII